MLKELKIIRKEEVKTSEVQVGDQIAVSLSGIGDFTATAQEITDKGVLFLFDECVARRSMNEKWTNKGGFKKSDLRQWMDATLFDAFPDELKSRLVYVTLPTYGQLFGHDEWYKENIEPDKDEQLPLMKTRKNRVADYNGDYAWYWLQNATKKSFSSGSFAGVAGTGDAVWSNAFNARGVRPVFFIG